ncbi:hypothetical protein [Cognataquiflexum rubidum]|uniref:hypothetical protein n=1 Tax=Cognataquiflexum rubidum TaxID=2922273 RepID=UPI001F145553|nr:hypothetical protein [Cognataquiflexum rubidum]MCH6236494.1 hypothetical protein [Cognataquiflexum rubidum]
MAKRSSIDNNRLELLKSKDIVYLITCFQSEYYCEDHHEGRCQRGFFSLFLQAVYGIQFAKRLNLDYYIDFGNLNYSYSEAEKFNGNQNFWEYYFKQAPKNPTSEGIFNLRFENYPLRVWNKSFFRELHQVVISNLQFRNEIQETIDATKERFNKLRVLGIHFRKTDHYVEVKPVKDSLFLKLVDKQIASFDRLFLATDDAQILELFENRYGDKLMYNSFVRSSGKVAIHKIGDCSNGYEIGKEALLDCLSLSLCDHAILSPSNLSYCALVFNPELPYQIAESSSAKRYRLKTLGAYYLNKWGIRKW